MYPPYWVSSIGGTYHGADGDFINRNALRKAVSLGGDSDTLACITGGMAEDFYGMPQELREETLKRLPEDIREAYERFRENALDRKVSAD